MGEELARAVDDFLEEAGITELFSWSSETSVAGIWPEFVSGSQGLSVVEFTNIIVAIEIKIGKNKGNSPKSSWLLLRPGF